MTHKPSASAPWRAARRVLLIRLDNLGDVLMCTPAMQAVRQACPGAWLTLLASPAGAALAPHLPMIDEVIAHRASWVKQPPSQGPSDDAALLARLRAGRFDAAIIFTTATQSALPAALMCRLAGIELRLATCRENPYELLTDWCPEEDVIGPAMRHEVQRQLDLVAAVGLHDRLATGPAPLRFAVRPADRQRAAELLQRHGCAARPYVLIHPGSSAPSRRYPPADFGRAAELLAQQGWACVFSASTAEAALVGEARAAMSQPSADLSGELPLGVLAALTEGAQLLLSNNSGPAHLAAAVGTPVVCLYALTNPQHTPWEVAARVLSHDVPCRNCLKSVCPQAHHPCLRGVTPQEVAAAALALLADSPLGPAPTQALPTRPLADEACA